MTKEPHLLEDILQEVVAGRRPSKWVTRERPKIDRIACPWAVLRFIDPDATILYAPAERVLETAARERAVAFDIPGAPISHEGELCSFGVLLRRFRLDDPALGALAVIIRGADTDRHGLAPEAAGLHGYPWGSRGISLTIRRFCAKASSSMTRSMRGPRRRAASAMPGPRMLKGGEP